jgi:hypothetical protein
MSKNATSTPIIGMAAIAAIAAIPSILAPTITLLMVSTNG